VPRPTGTANTETFEQTAARKQWSLVQSDAITPKSTEQTDRNFLERQVSFTVIQPTHGWASLHLAELWRYRELVFFLTWRDIRVRYKQTALGAAWAIVQPVVTMVIFTLVFGRVAHLPSAGVPYQVFTFAALLPWTYFSYVLQQSGNSLVANANMISKVYFPRLVLPLSTALAGLVDFSIALVVFGVMMAVYHVHVDLRVLTLPLFLLLAIVTSLGAGLWLSALSVKYRDVKYLLPFLTQVWLFGSPIAYSANLVQGKLSVLYALNPLVAVIAGFRWALLGSGSPLGWTVLPSAGMAIAVFMSGLFYFRRMEQTFADVI
jgi:lipopolysaccharide transport system permease protein